MDDLISRQAAIDALNDVVTLSRKTDAIVIQDYVRRVNNRLHDLPSIQPDDEEANYWHEKAKSYEQTLVKLAQSFAEQPERKKGRWIPYVDEDGDPYGDKCSECGARYVMPEGKTNYCPECGARMEGKR